MLWGESRNQRGAKTEFVRNKNWETKETNNLQELKTQRKQNWIVTGVPKKKKKNQRERLDNIK